MYLKRKKGKIAGDNVQLNDYDSIWTRGMGCAPDNIKDSTTVG